MTTEITSTVGPVAEKAMTAADVRTALLGRYPPSEYISINEAPEDSSRAGRKLDVLVISLWRSRGYEIDGIEVKVSVSDWRRELQNAAKADWWWSHVHRFYLAVPARIAPTIKAELPSGWGLLSCTPERVAELVKPEKHKPEAMPWQTCIGLFRASVDAGWNALRYAEQRGETRGRELAQKQFERTTGDESLRNKLDALNAQVDAFEQASGMKITDSYGTYTAKEFGEAAATVRAAIRDPEYFALRLVREAESAEAAAVTLRKVAHVFAREKQEDEKAR